MKLYVVNCFEMKETNEVGRTSERSEGRYSNTESDFSRLGDLTFVGSAIQMDRRTKRNKKSIISS